MGAVRPFWLPAAVVLLCLSIAAVMVASQAAAGEPEKAAPSAAQEPAREPATKKVLRAGAAASNITPMLDGGIVGGWSSPKATYIHDELFARCLVLDEGNSRIVIVVADNIGLPREVCDEAKKMIREHTGIAEDRVLIAATHTHSSVGARPANVLKPDDEYSPYARFVARRISDGVRRAVAHLEPAQIGWGTVAAPEHVNNRRWFLKPEVKLVNPFGGLDKVRMNPGPGSPELVKPAGPVDPEVCFVSVRSTGGRPIALLANYSLHYVGGVPATDISADYFGVFADRIQELLGADRIEPPFVAMLSNGTSGDVNNISFQKPRPPRKPYEQMRYVADDLAQKVFGAHKDIVWHDWVGLQMRQCELALKVRKPTAEQLQRAKAISGRRAGDTRASARGHIRPTDHPPTGSPGRDCRGASGGQDRSVGHSGDSLRGVRRNWPGNQAEKPAATCIHYLAGKRQLRLSAHACTARAGRLRDLAGNQQSGNRGFHENRGCNIGDVQGDAIKRCRRLCPFCASIDPRKTKGRKRA
jgi:neutral ceramidase